MQTRRKFLRDCSLAAVAVSVSPATAWSQSHGGGLVLPAEPGFAEFAGQVNSFFRVRAGFNTVRLLLVAATPLSSATADAPDAGNEKFTLRFRGPVEQSLGQDTYRFDHARLGRLFIFIVPTGWQDTMHCHYAAIFDRPADATQLAAQRALAPLRVQNQRAKSS